MNDIDYSMLPEHMQDGARLYVEEGIPPGSFMEAALSNKLVEAFGRADETNTECMRYWASWLYNDCPRIARGSQEAVDNWIKVGGLKGRAEARKGIY